MASIFVGVADLDLATLLISRAPRTVALLLAGSALAVSGLVMQLLVRNRFVEPSTAGTTEFASLGILLATMWLPAAPVGVKMLCGAACALVGTAIFLRILRGLPTAQTLLVPLVGIMLGGIVGALATFLALQNDLLQSLGAWTNADFSTVIAGRYELLWLVGLLTVVLIVTADRFTVAGLGADLTTSLGLNHRATVRFGMGLVSVVVAVIVVTTGAIPFLGLVVPNVARIILGDNARRSVLWVALGGAGLVLACDLLARLLRYPAELPLGTVLGVVGAAVFLRLLLKDRRVTT
ncbi:iron complex transport system permease protein [Kineosphaera limosa]|uniref:ABC transporter permease n=1 Tax=Kineosphaera limosa TaxID=111564 RepID=UPI0017D77A43|nr:iron chelate uptake ABC transporter family permease subunit [Kineosphaera limosa]NYD98944.1 iron complex transport system permease protein [Kineosphaera limosa]